MVQVSFICTSATCSNWSLLIEFFFGSEYSFPKTVLFIIYNLYKQVFLYLGHHSEQGETVFLRLLLPQTQANLNH